MKSRDKTGIAQIIYIEIHSRKKQKIMELEPREQFVNDALLSIRSYLILSCICSKENRIHVP